MHDCYSKQVYSQSLIIHFLISVYESLQESFSSQIQTLLLSFYIVFFLKRDCYVAVCRRNVTFVCFKCFSFLQKLKVISLHGRLKRLGFMCMLSEM